MSKPRMYETIDVYAKLVYESFLHTLHQRSFLFVAVLASFAYSGAVVLNVLNLALNAASIANLEKSVIAVISPFAWFLGNISTTSEAGFNVLSFTVALVVSITLFCLGVLAQQILVNGINRNSNKPAEVVKLSGQFNFRHLIDVLFLNVIIFIANLSLLSVTVYALNLIGKSSVMVQTMGTIGTYTVLLPLAFAVNAIAMQSIIRVVTHSTHTLEAIRIAIKEFYDYPLAMLEMALLIFAVQFLLVLGILFFVLLVAVLGLLFLSIVSGSSSLLVFQSGSLSLAIIFAGLLIFGVGLMTSFTFHAWVHFSHHLHHSGIIPVIHHLTDSIKLAFKRS
jgi:hypothetical protein